MQSTLNTRLGTQSIAAVCFFLVAGVASVIGQAPPAAALAIAQGRETYRLYCASCHGEQATGNGPAALAFKSRPTDLTRLTARTGRFPAAALEAVIKGVSESDPVRPPAPDHEPIPAHGSYAMPVWGPYFVSVAGSEREAQERLTNLVKYIESIQAR